MHPFKDQANAANLMYTPRAAKYEDSWHPEYSKRFMDLVPIQPGDRILDLACGTGLEAVIAADLVGDEGIVIGVDVTAAMLAEAQKKLDQDPTRARRLTLLQHDVTDLTDCAHVQKGSFDLILCSNAFVLFQHPEQVVAHWREYLKPGGKAVIDITHQHNLRSGLLLEKSKDSFREILEQQGFVVEKTEILEKEPGLGTTYLGLDQADKQFDYILNGPLPASVITDEIRHQGREYFRQEWKKAAVDGKVEVSDVLYVYIARRA
ncbi:hypothetical protein FZEAL_9340 [Fusarium zealandicum]|uniref:Methyltransferase domain-containing protein n=1 Tax=Fusarium zealandicum TaxID=1053134 RepID=A0A8H4XFM0_9HYPO|nr:hypothetical protein FZEAL_9340 [Fusarium zealandicum]